MGADHRGKRPGVKLASLRNSVRLPILDHCEFRGSCVRVSAAFKIAIVGSGPAGLSAAGRAAQLGLPHVLLEKTDHLSDTIYKYQKGKHVMATPSQLVLRSDFGFDAGKREKILGLWEQQSARQ